MPRHNQQIKHIRLVSNNCQPKRQFLNEREAIKAAEFQMLIKPNLELSTYQCNICKKWHLTRQPKN